MRISPPTRGAVTSFYVSERGWGVTIGSPEQAEDIIKKYPSSVLALAAALVLPKFRTTWYRGRVEDAQEEIRKLCAEWGGRKTHEE